MSEFCVPLWLCALAKAGAIDFKTEAGVHLQRCKGNIG